MSQRALASLGIAFTILFACVPACAALGGPTPDPKLYPCGINGVNCGGGFCCWENFDCGGLGMGCPAEQCCYNGQDDVLQGKRKMRPQGGGKREP